MPHRACRWAYLALTCLVMIACPARGEPCAPRTNIELTRVAAQAADHWTRQEKWVWARTLAGDIADFNELYDVKLPLDPNQSDPDWYSNTEPRRLSQRFLSDVLTDPELAESVPRRGVRIVGALFPQDVDLVAVRFNREIWFNKSRFEGHLYARYAKLGHLSLEGSTFCKTVDMEKADIDLHLMLSAKATFNGLVYLFGTRVGGNLLADDSTFNADLQMQSAEIGINLLLRNHASFQGEVGLAGVRVGGSLDAGNATFVGPLIMAGARINRNLHLSGSRFDGGILLNSTQVDGTLWPGEPSDWPRTGALHLHGLAYERISSRMMGWSASQYEDWLARDTSSSPQPYQQLARVLREAGAYDKANEVLHAGREHERSQAGGLRWFWLTLLNSTIGYGIGTGYFRALIPAGLLTVVGMLVLRTGDYEARKPAWAWCFWASFDEIIPLVQLDEAHARFIDANLSSWRLAYFYIHRVAAFLLGSFVVAGLAGLTQGT